MRNLIRVFTVALVLGATASGASENNGEGIASATENPLIVGEASQHKAGLVSPNLRQADQAAAEVLAASICKLKDAPDPGAAYQELLLTQSNYEALGSPELFDGVSGLPAIMQVANNSFLITKECRTTVTLAPEGNRAWVFVEYQIPKAGVTARYQKVPYDESDSRLWKGRSLFFDREADYTELVKDSQGRWVFDAPLFIGYVPVTTDTVRKLEYQQIRATPARARQQLNANIRLLQQFESGLANGTLDHPRGLPESSTGIVRLPKNVSIGVDAQYRRDTEVLTPNEHKLVLRLANQMVTESCNLFKSPTPEDWCAYAKGTLNGKADCDPYRFYRTKGVVITGLGVQIPDEPNCPDDDCAIIMRFEMLGAFPYKGKPGAFDRHIINQRYAPSIGGREESFYATFAAVKRNKKIHITRSGPLPRVLLN